MSYQLDLDEYDEHRLVNELNRRKISQDAGLCDYCGRNTDPPCKFPSRHAAAVVRNLEKLRDIASESI